MTQITDDLLERLVAEARANAALSRARRQILRLEAEAADRLLDEALADHVAHPESESAAAVADLARKNAAKAWRRVTR